MSLFFRPFLMSALLVTVLAGCAEPESSVAENQPPTVVLLEPRPGATFRQDSPIDILAEADDLSHVIFSVDGAEVGEAVQAPYLHTFTPREDKAYLISATAQDEEGAQSLPESVTIQVEAPTDVYTLLLSVSGLGRVTSTPAGIACPDTCRATFEAGREVVLTAAPDEVSSLLGWSGACAGTDTTCTLTPSSSGDVQVSAAFEAREISVSLSPERAVLTTGETRTFTASVTGSENVAVTWRTSGGTVDGDGTTVSYTAPNEAGNYSLMAKSLADPTEQASSSIQVNAPSPKSVKVAAAGDISCGDYSPTGADKCHDQQTANLVANIDPDLVLLLGDIQYDPSTYQDFLDHYDKSWGAFKAITRPAVGNHGYDDPTPNAEGYFKYFGAAAGDPDKGYYSFDTGAWHVVVLNTNDECTVVACAEDSNQERWLRDDLAASTQRCTLAVTHHPRYNSGNHGNAVETKDLWRALYEAGADLVLSGHAHHYERFAPQDDQGAVDNERGLRSFIVGTGGKSLEPTGSPIDNSEKIVEDTYGVLELTLNSATYDWRFVSEPAGKVLDKGNGKCH